MFRDKGILYVVVAFALVISGCVSAPPEVAPAPTPAPAETPATSVEVLGSPSSAEAGKSFEVTWKVNSPVQKNIPHTAVHYGSESKSEPLTLQSYPSLTTPQSSTVPNEFKASIVINTSGVTYFRAHAIIDGNHYWSSEKMITISSPANVTQVAPSIKVTNYPGAVTGDENFTISWEVSGGMLGEITHTAVHWGYRSGRADIKDYGYFSRVYTGKTPQQFSVVLKAPSGGGPLYFRAHALVDGIDVYTPEYMITINPKYTGGGGGY